jgi:hypothetical protein
VEFTSSKARPARAAAQAAREIGIHPSVRDYAVRADHISVRIDQVQPEAPPVILTASRLPNVRGQVLMTRKTMSKSAR